MTSGLKSEDREFNNCEVEKTQGMSVCLRGDILSMFVVLCGVHISSLYELFIYGKVAIRDPRNSR